MAEPTKTAAKSEPESKPAKADLIPAGQSGDPVVQKLLAERAAHESNASTEPDEAVVEQRKVANAAIEAIDGKLADLGFTAK